MKGRDGTLKTRVIVTKGKKKRVTESDEMPGHPVVADALSNVGYGVAFTRGLPNFSSIRVEVSCHLPCVRGMEIVAFREARNFALKRLRRESSATMDVLEKELRE